MTMHLFGTVLTSQAVAHNNRGESEGTVSTLQKVIRNGDLFSTISSEAIRYALREGWLADEELKLNRKVTHNESTWVDKEFKKPEDFIDNDVLGYMHAKKETVSRRGILEISRAVSTTPWPGTISAHFASPGSNPAVATDNPIPYQCEVHDTRYQYTFAFTPDSLLKSKKSRTEKTLLAIQNLRRPAGNQLIEVFTEDHRHVIRIRRCTSVSHAIAAVAVEMSRYTAPPALHFGWPEMTLVEASWSYLVFGEGNIPWRVRELIAREQSDVEHRPRVIVG